MTEPVTRRAWLNPLLGVLLAAFLLASLAIVVWRDDTWLISDLVPQHSATDAQRETRDYAAVSRAATEWTEAFMEVDYSHMDALMAAVLERSTGPFRKEYDESRVRLKALSQDNLTKSTGKVRDVGVGEVKDDTAVVFVAADGTVENKSTKGKKVARYYRLKLTLTRVEGHWLTSGVEFVG